METARLYYGRLRQFFDLPRCYSKVRNFKEYPKSGLTLATDLLTLFFSYRTFPDHYGPCRLWEANKSDWKYYYGSNYHPHQRLKLSISVQQSEYRALFDDKFLCATYCKGLGLKVPHTFGVVDPDEDYRGRIRSWFEASNVERMIIKPLLGRAGMGIVLAKRIEDGITIQSANDSVSLDRFPLKDRSIIQEYIRQHAKMSVFSPSSVNTLRIVTMMTRQGEVIIVNASMRTGARRSFVDNFSAGGISAGVDCRTGQLKKYAYDNRWNRYERHPESGIVFESYEIPGWERVLDFAGAVQNGFPYYRLIGSDIAIDQDGEPVLIEVNGAPDLVGLEQKAGPLFRNQIVLRTFGEYDLLVNKHQKKLLYEIRNEFDGETASKIY